MANQTITLNVEKRTAGKSSNRKLRSNKLIPAVVYGVKTENQNLCLDENTVIRYSSHGHENTIFNFTSPQKELNGLSVIMKEVVVHPVSRRPTHVDFYALDMSATIRVHVEIRFEGRPVGVAEDGGLFQILMRDVEIECLPKDIPEYLTIDISNLGLNESLHVSDLAFPAGTEAVSAGDLAIANVTLPKEESTETAPAEGAEAAAAAPAEADKKPEKKS